jgi:hypothetical protein
VSAAVKRSFRSLHEAFATVAREAGATPAVARARAEQAVLQIQGALVLARGSGDRGPFERVLKALPGALTRG